MDESPGVPYKLRTGSLARAFDRGRRRGRMGDSDSDDDLFAPKAAATRVGRVVKPAEKYSARPAEATSARARMLSECDFLKEVGRARARPRPCARSPVPCRRSPPVGEALARRLTRLRL